MTPLEDAQAFVLGSCPPADPVEVPRQAALGLVLAAPVVATTSFFYLISSHF